MKDIPEIKIEWRPIVGYEGIYSVSNTGMVRRESKNKVLSNATDNNGYVVILLYKIGEKRRLYKMHRIVMAAFVGICPEGYQVNHIDGNKGNNHISNLEYVTSKENVLHAYKNGLRKSGQDSPLATITNEIAIKIRNEYKRYVVTSVMLAKKYNTTPAVVKTVVGGNKWKYIK